MILNNWINIIPFVCNNEHPILGKSIHHRFVSLIITFRRLAAIFPERLILMILKIEDQVGENRLARI